MKKTITILVCFRLLISLKAKGHASKVAIAVLLLLAHTPNLTGQIVLQDVIMGRAVVSDPGSVKMTPGFHAMNGSAFRAYIGTVQGQNSSYTVTPFSSDVTPVAGTGASNYVKTITYREAKTAIPTSNYKHLEEFGYFDGLGRPRQTVSVGASPSGYDIVQPVLYDEFGREAKKTLPYTDARSGAFRTAVTESTVNTFYNNPGNAATEGIDEDGRAYTQITFDNSPLNRVVSQTGPGTAWTSKPVATNYLVNTASDPVTGWTVNANGTFTSFSYQENSLYVFETIDEQGNITREYKDKQDRVVQKSSWLGAEWLRTAYVYDDFDLLRCVVPPLASGPENTNLCYYYNYDKRKRMVEKRIPGGGTTKMIYDKRDRLRCTQNGNQASASIKEWSFIKYDVLNRPVITGVIKNYTIDTSVVRSAVDAAPLNETRNNTASYYGYDNESFPKGALSVEVHTAVYYDNDDFIAGMGLNDSLNSVRFDAGSYNFAAKTDLSPKGQVTGTMTRVLSASADNGAVPLTTLYSTSYYDKYGHLLRTISENHLRGKDVISNIYEDITYLVLQSKQQHYKGGQVLTLEKTFEYDHTGRLLATRAKVNSQAEITLNAMKYNELGQLITRYLHSNQTSGSRSFIQKVDYNYNIRGWLNRINDPALTGDNDLFGMLLCYESTAALGSLNNVEGCYNGNISGMKWGVKNETVAARGYAFTYDELNRLKTTGYAEGALLSENTGYFTESVTSYDKNGNIKGLQRKYNNILVDNLTYTYNANSNQVLNITDGGTASSQVDDYPGNSANYAYDANGNMITDGSRNAIIAYHNTINMPSSVDFGNNNRIFYHYAAGGVKLLKHVDPAGGTDTYTHYIGNIVYENGRISYVITEEGRLVNISTSSTPVFVYEYNLKDHLGNSRVTFLGTNLGGAVDVVQTTHYYPFGLVLSQTNNNSAPDYAKNKYLYNGKELQDDRLNGAFFGLLDYGARFYDPQIGRFTGLDPLANKFVWITPYNYAENDPVGAIDLWGLQKLKIAGNFSITTGKVGAEVKIANLLGIGGSIYPAGGGSQTIEAYVEINTKTGSINLGASHSDKVIDKGNSTTIGPFHHSESREMETKRDLSTNNGATKKDEKIFKNKESGGIGPVGTEETNGSSTVFKSDFESKVAVNAGMVGVEVGMTLEYTPASETQAQNNNQKQGQTQAEITEDKKYTKNQY